MFHRGFHFGRLVMLALLLFGAMSVGRGVYRSGFEDGFVRGMAFTATAGDEATADGVAAIPPAYVPDWRGSRFGPAEGGFLRFGFLGVALLGLGFLAFMSMLFMTAARHRHWAHGHPGHHGPHGGHGRHGPGGHRHPGHDTPGPEKQPEDYV